MIFKANMALSLTMISLVAGMFLLIYSAKKEIGHRIFATVVAWFVVILSIAVLLCSAYYKVRYMEDGYYKKAHYGKMMKDGMRGGKGMRGMMDGRGMGKGMKDCPMMKMMEEKTELMEESTPSSE